VQVQKVVVGNIADLRTISVDEVGGVPVKELQRSIRDMRGGRLTGFVQPADPNNPMDLMPPNAPATLNWEGNRLGPPPFLEDIEVELEVGGGGAEPWGACIVRGLDVRGAEALSCAPAGNLCFVAVLLAAKVGRRAVWRLASRPSGRPRCGAGAHAEYLQRLRVRDWVGDWGSVI
jgi:hypothetical protein